MCVQNYQCDEAIILRYGRWGCWDPSPAGVLLVVVVVVMVEVVVLLLLLFF